MNMSSKITLSGKRPTRGIILMVDALGISSYSLNECKGLLDKLNRLKSKFKEQKEGALGILSFKFLMFGDTIIIYAPLDSDFEGSMSILSLVCLQISDIFEWGFKNKILFRGTIAIGDYVANDEFILGPAMFDANTWCEVADWFGIIFTPKSRLWIESMMERLGKSYKGEFNKVLDFEPIFVEYDVPLSKPIDNAKTKNFLTYNWTNLLFFSDLKRNETPLQKFLDLVYEIPMSGYGEPKIAYGVKYFKDIAAGNYLNAKINHD
jgi:hypothetical protein